MIVTGEIRYPRRETSHTVSLYTRISTTKDLDQIPSFMMLPAASSLMIDAQRSLILTYTQKSTPYIPPPFQRANMASNLRLTPNT